MKNFIERLEDLKFTATGMYANGYNSALNKAKELFNELHPSTEIPAPEPEKQAKEGSFKVRVKKAREGQWYYGKVGREFDVVVDDTVYYKVIEGARKSSFLFKSDCEIIPDENLVVKEDMICPISKQYCDDECCTVGSKCNISGNEISNAEKETTTIPFDYQRWKSGDYLRVVTRNWRDVEQLVEFKCDDEFRLYGVIDNSVEVWRLDGRYKNSFDEYAKDLHLEIATPPKKQVTTYHWIDSLGYVCGSANNNRLTFVGETITEQQPDGTWKIISTTLK